MQDNSRGQHAAEEWTYQRRHTGHGEVCRRGSGDDKYHVALCTVARRSDSEQGALQFKIGSGEVLRPDAPRRTGYLLAHGAGRSQTGLELIASIFATGKVTRNGCPREMKFIDFAIGRQRSIPVAQCARIHPRASFQMQRFSMDVSCGASSPTANTWATISAAI